MTDKKEKIELPFHPEPLLNDMRFISPKTGKVICSFNKCLNRFELKKKTEKKHKTKYDMSYYECTKCKRIYKPSKTIFNMYTIGTSRKGKGV